MTEPVVDPTPEAATRPEPLRHPLPDPSRRRSLTPTLVLFAAGVALALLMVAMTGSPTSRAAESGFGYQSGPDIVAENHRRQEAGRFGGEALPPARSAVR